MTRPIGNVDAVKIQETKFSVEDFRKMVNYENPKNKGYVRFTKAIDGTFKLEKINNKIDIFVSWRSNVDSANNRRLLERFSKAFEDDMKYMSAQDINDIKYNIYGRNVGDDVSPLSRKTIKKVFEAYDKVFNSTQGRLSILNNLFLKAMSQCGYTGDVEIFKKDVLGLSQKDREELVNAFAKVENLEDIPKATREKMLPSALMKMSDLDFRTLLIRLENKVTTVVFQKTQENNFYQLGKNFLENDLMVDTFQDKDGVLRKCLSDIMKAEKIKEVELGEGLENKPRIDFSLGNKGFALTMFIDKVVPLILKDAIQRAKVFGGTQKEKEEILRAFLSYENLSKHLKEFMEGAQEALDLEKKIADLREVYPNESDDCLLERIGENQCDVPKSKCWSPRMAILNRIRSEIINNVAYKNGTTFRKQFEGMYESFVKDSLFKQYINSYLLDKFEMIGKDIQLEKISAAAEMDDYFMQKIRPALQMVLGDAGSTIDMSEHHGAEGLYEKLLNPVAELCNKYRGGKVLYEKLFNCTFRNILNYKLENAIERRENMKLQETQLTKIKALLENTARTYYTFNVFCRRKLISQIDDTYNVMLNRQVKKGNIDENQADFLYDRLYTKLDSVCNAALERFLEESPVEDTDRTDPNLPIRMGIDMITQFFEEEKNAVINEANVALSVQMLKNATTSTTIERLTEPESHVNKFLNTDENKKLAEEITNATGMSRAQLMKTLESFFNHLLNQKISGIRINNTLDHSFFRDLFSKEIDRNFAEVFLKEEFPTKAKEFLKNMMQTNKLYEEQLKFKIEENCKDSIAMHSDVFEDIPTASKNAYTEKMSNRMFVEFKNLLQAHRNTVLSQPDQKFDPDKVSEMIYHKLTSSTINGVAAVKPFWTKINLQWTKNTDMYLNNKSDGKERNFKREMVNGVKDELIEKKGYSIEPSALSQGISYMEWDMIVDQEVRSSFNYRKGCPYVYGFMSRKEFDEDFFNEVLGKCINRFGKLIDFKKKFLTATEEVRNKYSAVTVKIAEDVFEAKVMDYITNGKGYPQMNVIVEDYENELRTVAQEKLDDLTKARDFSLDTSDSFNKVIQEYRSVLEDNLAGNVVASVAGLDDEELKKLAPKYIGHMVDRFQEKFQGRLDNLLAQKAKANAKGIVLSAVEENLKKIEDKADLFKKNVEAFIEDAKNEAYAVLDRLHSVFYMYDATTPSGRRSLLERSRFSSYVKKGNESMFKEMYDTFEKWLQTETGKQGI